MRAQGENMHSRFKADACTHRYLAIMTRAIHRREDPTARPSPSRRLVTVICTSICHSMPLRDRPWTRGSHMTAAKARVGPKQGHTQWHPRHHRRLRLSIPRHSPTHVEEIFASITWLSRVCHFSTRSALRRPSLNLFICFAACVVVLFSTAMLSSLHGWAGEYFLAMSPLSRRNTYSSGSPCLSEQSFSLQLIFRSQFRRWRIMLVQYLKHEILTITTV